MKGLTEGLDKTSHKTKYWNDVDCWLADVCWKRTPLNAFHGFTCHGNLQSSLKCTKEIARRNPRKSENEHRSYSMPWYPFTIVVSL